MEREQLIKKLNELYDGIKSTPDRGVLFKGGAIPSTHTTAKSLYENLLYLAENDKDHPSAKLMFGQLRAIAKRHESEPKQIKRIKNDFGTWAKYEYID